jgi:DNA invertase Pin-like site-specific DNA recombinase
MTKEQRLQRKVEVHALVIQGKTPEQIAEILQITVPAVMRWFRRLSYQRKIHAIRKQHDEWTKQGYAEGKTDGQIAKEHPDLTRDLVRTARLRLGLPALQKHLRLEPETRAELRRMIQSGADKATVMDYFGISETTYYEYRKRSR